MPKLVRFLILIPCVFLLAMCGPASTEEPDPTPEETATTDPTPTAESTTLPEPTPTPEEMAFTLIQDVQGDSSTPSYPDSPFEDMTVTIEGVVTGDFQDGEAGTQGDINGFYVQEEADDVASDLSGVASSGIYVFERNGTLTDVSVGDVVQVTGTVDEIRGLTQMEADSVTISGSDTVEPIVLTLPVADLGDWEAYENMLVTITGADDVPLTVNDTFDLGRFGSLQVSSGGRVVNYSQVITPTDRAAFESYRQENGLRTLIIDDGRTNQNPEPMPAFNGSPFDADNTVRVGYTLESVTGILEFRFDEWRIHPTEPITLNTESNPRQDSAPDVGGTVQVAVMNVLNYYNGDGQGGGFPTARGADTESEFERQRAKTLAALRGLDADIIGLVEIENDFDTGIESAIQDLVDGLNAEPDATSCGANWTYVDVTQAPLTVDALGTDSIAVGIIYCEATVVLAPDTIPAFLDDAQVADLGLSDLLPVFNGVNTNRVPLAATFQEIASGETFTVVVNHFKSKGGEGEDGNADSGNGAASWNERRRNAVTALNAWLATNPTGSDDPDILLLGDFNAYAAEDPIQDILALGYENLAGSEAYSYGFPLALGIAPETQSWGTLDYAFASTSLAPQVEGAAVWAINADEPRYLDYNEEFKPEDLLPTLYDDDPFRSSDHDPIIVGITLGED